MLPDHRDPRRAIAPTSSNDPLQTVDLSPIPGDHKGGNHRFAGMADLAWSMLAKNGAAAALYRNNAARLSEVGRLLK
jgi:hypothetical protein